MSALSLSPLTVELTAVILTPTSETTAGDIANQARAVTGGDQDGRKVALLSHTDPTDGDQPFTFAFAIAADILTVGAMDNCSLAATDKADDLIAGQWTATVGEACQ